MKKGGGGGRAPYNSHDYKQKAKPVRSKGFTINTRGEGTVQGEERNKSERNIQKIAIGKLERNPQGPLPKKWEN